MEAGTNLREVAAWRYAAAQAPAEGPAHGTHCSYALLSSGSTWKKDASLAAVMRTMPPSASSLASKPADMTRGGAVCRGSACVITRRMRGGQRIAARPPHLEQAAPNVGINEGGAVRAPEVVVSDDALLHHAAVQRCQLRILPQQHLLEIAIRQHSSERVRRRRDHADGSRTTTGTSRRARRQRRAGRLEPGDGDIPLRGGGEIKDVGLWRRGASQGDAQLDLRPAGG